ncbi:hypothetical protein ROZALSC1DRAFT_28135 [Rozella allomycis CSF55]|uniref:Alginate lyase domain-containing protein n=1 Tax=Rozella allomycis (strain CSF55) TaxID=988480 RepID=A0A075B3W8_ROZAC|nr:hypothetical protein O9G_002651 [Rozella allomycis CSF55]RKP20370.1 hypothetical protein ROZALSC1DRAFT_28135 [Rozella allomycis CSF55]|eukprot:EPZ35643.1 hypothetical protein O9G_002651 [Rozella allomycis CSF55]
MKHFQFKKSSLIVPILFAILYICIFYNVSSKKLALVRIIGNDLPPRHSPGQSLSNLKFLLENEEEFADTEKIWIINRIVDLEKEKEIIRLLDHHNKTYYRIPFVMEEYQNVMFNYNRFHVPDIVHSKDFQLLSKTLKNYVYDEIYHYKNLYAMNNNGGRQFALDVGNQIAEWTFVLDGNIFLTEEAFNDIMHEIKQYGSKFRYFVVPMIRLTSNDQLLERSGHWKRIWRMNATEEPQIIFHKRAAMTFNPNMRYGRRSKAELLWRLGIDYGYSKRRILPWETDISIGSNKLAKEIAYVFRLFSGSAEQEISGGGGARNRNRLSAIQAFINGLDIKVMQKSISNISPKYKFLLWDENHLFSERIKFWEGEKDNALITIIDYAQEVVKSNKELSIGNDYTKQLKAVAIASFCTNHKMFNKFALNNFMNGINWINESIQRNETFDKINSMFSILELHEVFRLIQPFMSTADEHYLAYSCSMILKYLKDMDIENNLPSALNSDDMMSINLSYDLWITSLSSISNDWSEIHRIFRDLPFRHQTHKNHFQSLNLRRQWNILIEIGKRFGFTMEIEMNCLYDNIEFSN